MARKKKKLTKAQRAKISRRNLKKAHAANRRKHGHRRKKQRPRGCGRGSWRGGGNANWRCKPGKKRHTYYR